MNTLAVIGLGYVGLPLVVEFGKHVRTIGFDIAQHKVDACRACPEFCVRGVA
jgi:UDP-N-acetyl-D-galactosamine dehydrogenase